MKKITILFLITLISKFCFSQEPAYARAYLFSTGFRDENTNQIVWNGNPKECDILIRFENNDLTIYSKTIQKYHVIKKLIQIINLLYLDQLTRMESFVISILVN